MSWQVATRVHRAFAIRSAVEHAQPTADVSDLQARQIAKAKKAAIAMLDASIAGDAHEENSELAFRVQLHGHVAPPGEGALPSATVIVEQLPANLAEEDEEVEPEDAAPDVEDPDPAAEG